jgi:hypothetical protein
MFMMKHVLLGLLIEVSERVLSVSPRWGVRTKLLHGLSPTGKDGYPTKCTTPWKQALINAIRGNDGEMRAEGPDWRLKRLF